MNLCARINHAEGASGVGLTLRPTGVIMFGNPKAGTPLVLCEQTVAIDLPQESLIWEDKEGQVWLSYDDPASLAKRHDISGCDEVIKKISSALAAFAHGATGDGSRGAGKIIPVGEVVKRSS